MCIKTSHEKIFINFVVHFKSIALGLKEFQNVWNHIVWNKLILLVAIEMKTEIINEKVASQLKNISLFDTSIERCVQFISNDLKMQLLVINK